MGKIPIENSSVQRRTYLVLGFSTVGHIGRFFIKKYNVVKPSCITRTPMGP